MRIYQRLRPYGMILGLTAIATFFVVLLWQQLVQQEQLFDQPTVLAHGVLVGGVVTVWTSALVVLLWQRSERHAQRVCQINHHYRRLIQNLNAGYIVHTPDTRIVMCNPIACGLLGLSLEDVLGKGALDSVWHFIDEAGTVIPPASYPVNRVLANSIPLKNFILGICKPQQPTTWVLVSAFPEFDDHHRILQVVVTLIDITEQQAALRDRQRVEAERHQAEMALYQSEATKQAIMEAIPDLMIRMRSDGTYLDVISNQEVPIINPQQVQNHATVYAVLPPHLAHLRMHHINLALQLGHVQSYEHELYIAGEAFYEEVRVVPLLPDEVLVIVRDMTARKRAEMELQAQKTFLQQVIDAVPSSIFVKDLEGRFLIVNQAAASIHGVSIEAMLGQRDQDINVNRVQANEFSAQNLQVAEQRIPITFPDQAICNHQGDIHWYQTTISPFLDGEGQLKGFIGNAVEVSDRKRAETDLRHQKEMFQAIVNHIPVMLAQFNAAGHIELANPELEKVLGWSLEDWQQRDVFSLCYPDPDYRQQVLDHMLAADGTWRDWTSQTASGQVLETSWANVRLSNGHFVGIGQDVGDRKRRELALQQAMETAEAANLAKSLFLANMSHELRTPLNVILGFTQLMAHDTNLTPDQQEDLQTIRRSGDHLLNLINDVLDLSKIETGHSALEVNGVDLIALLHSLRQMLMDRATSKGIRLTFKIAPTVPQFILSDAQKLRQILLNLLGNALKFTQQGEVTLEVVASSAHTVPQDAHDLWLQFAVSDTGSGIAPEEVETIFDAFVQAQSGRQLASGTGLGLTISRKLVELLGGTITVQSTFGQGSTFTVGLPVRPCSGINGGVEAGDRRSITGLAPGQPQRRILVVDDQPENRLLLVRLLAPLGFAVQEASNGEEAVRLWQEWHPDLIWMDIRMPILNGYEATRKIRALDPEPNTIIIALTAQTSQSDRPLVLAAGCNDYISKPFCTETIFLKMQEYLGLEYCYAGAEVMSASADNTALPTPTPTIPPVLPTTLPPDWLSALEEAAVCGNDRAIAHLSTLLPPDQAQLATYLIELANQYQFEQILTLVEPLRHQSQASSFPDGSCSETPGP